MFNRILVVCIGNICRSPTAERLLQAALPDKEITSAGLGALVDHEMEATAQRIMQGHRPDIDVSNHKARQLNAELTSQSDLILVMERSHLNHITKRYPQASGKTMLLGQWRDSQEIPDPYRKSDEAFEFAYKLIAENCDEWAKRLK